MRKFVLAAITSGALLAGPALAIECEHGQGRDVVLDWKTMPGSGTPMPFMGTRVVSEKCIDGANIFAIKGMPGTYATEADAVASFTHVQAVVHSGLPEDQMAAAIAYVKALEERGGEHMGPHLYKQDATELAYLRFTAKRDKQ